MWYIQSWWPYACNFVKVEERTVNHANIYIGNATYPQFLNFMGGVYDHVLDSRNSNTSGPIPWTPTDAGDYQIAWGALINTTDCHMMPDQPIPFYSTVHVRSAIHTGTPCNGALIGGSTLPTVGPGYYHYLGSDPPNTDNWGGTEAIIQLIADTAATWTNSHSAPNIGVGDISLEGGGPFQGHSCHQNGTEADIRYVRNDGQDSGLDLSVQPGLFSKALTIELMNLFAQSGLVDTIFVDPASGITSADVPGVTISYDYSGVHINHFHVRMYDPDGDDTNFC
jgi:murein endopeptidase